MLLKKLKNLEEITAIDEAKLREILNPLHADGALQLGYSLAHAAVKPGRESLPHRLKTTSEVYYILKGEGVMYVDREQTEIKSGDTIYVPPGSRQYIRNRGKGELTFLCIVSPPWKADDEELT